MPVAFLDQLECLFTNPLAERSWTGRTANQDEIHASVLWDALSSNGLRQLLGSERDVAVQHLRCRGWRDADQLAVLANLISANGSVDSFEQSHIKAAVAALRTLYLDEEWPAQDEEVRRELRRVEAACEEAKIEIVREGDGDQKASLISATFWERARAARTAAMAAVDGAA